MGWREHVDFLLLLLSLFFLYPRSCSGVSAGGPHELHTLKHLRLRKLREATVHTVHSPDGDVIHCVRREKQPALEHPRLKGHIVQYAVGQLDQDSIHGTYAIFDAGKPAVAMQREMSIAQLWLVAGNYSSTFLDTIEAGWTVEPQAYGDTNTRFFIYWTNDFYKSSGCLDLRCPGFIQVSNDMVLGGTIGPTSDFERQLEMQPILVWKERVTGHWWLRIGMTNIGYWPAILFKNGLQEKATRVQWGGEITNYFSGGLHTTTQMGSGHFANEGFGKACYARSLHIVDSSNTLYPVPSSIRYVSSRPTCYSVSHAFNEAWGSAFYFGGPGHNANCL
ncbi:hypothetical protein GOP47_0014711 [Adiantum capillus-veneris]|uniref:Neprosin PEP catalytic domain-containing protein n=1 Tax=Adiantum capillus-veneris TaxID=13818 RepID=A0A9D4UN66_ADICA|nr:hypothetical protein GOP47_0014711 [Adiantum capillus-veneris]